MKALLIRPFQVKGMDMYPSTLLACKVLTCVAILYRLPGKFQFPFLPLFRPLDVFLPITSAMTLGIQIVFYSAAIALLLNIRPRYACFVLGGCVLLLLIGSRIEYRNHIFIVACVFLLSACHRRDERPWLLLVQVVVLYIFSALNKAWEPDWRSGQFMDNWLDNEIGWYVFLGDFLPPRMFAKILSWGSIFAELTIGCLFLVKSYRSLAVWLAGLFHFSLYIALDGMTFGFFLQDAMILLIVFLHLHNEQAVLYVPPRWQDRARSLKHWFDFDDHFKILAEGSSFTLITGYKHRFEGFAAVRSAILRLPVLYFGLLALMTGLRHGLPHSIGYPITSVTFIALWIVAFPYDFKSSVGHQQ